jgi:RND family efflux transporter MFP subunit
MPSLLLSTALVLLSLGLASCQKQDAAAKGAGPQAAASAAWATAPVLLLAPEDIVTIQTRPLATGPVITGSVQPERKADLRAEVAAVVIQVFKESGESVRAGDLLMRLDDTAIRDSLTSADEAVRAAQQAFDQSERQVQRLKTLQLQGMTSTQALEDAEVRRNNAQSDLVAAKARTVAARQQLQRTSVRAPFDGVLSDRKASVGDTVQIGKELIKVIDPRSMRFEGLVSADRLGDLRTGQRVSFRVNGYTQGDFLGKVRRIDAAANATTRQVALIVNFDDPAVAPKVAGLFAEGRVETGSEQGLMVSEASLVRSGDTAQVWRLDGRMLSKVEVKLGERDSRSGKVPVRSGLAAGDRVLRNPGSGLVNGQRFEFAVPAEAALASGASGPAVSSASGTGTATARK